MKRFKKVGVFLLLVFIFPVSGKCQNIIEEQIIGEWIFNYETSLENMDEAAKFHFENMDANRQANIQDNYQNRKLMFGEGGGFLQEFSGGGSVEGSWSLRGGEILDIMNSSGHVISFKIELLNDKILVIHPIRLDEGTANMLFSKWYLLKA